MATTKVLILTEGSQDIGFGHLTRCLSIAQAFEERGIQPFFVVYGDSTVGKVLDGVPYKVFAWFEDLERLKGFLKGTDIVVVDSYKAPLEVYQTIASTSKVALYIDDDRRLEYPRGIVLNPTVGAENFTYPEGEGKEYLLGAKYIPLRKPFWDVPPKKVNQKVEKVLITFGGDDLRSLTPKVLKLLNDHFGELKKFVVIGGGFKKETVEQIKSLKGQKTELIFNADAKLMKTLMLESDIAISAGGQTLYELARVGTPAVAVGVVDNQKYNLQNWQKLGFIEFAGYWNSPELESRILDGINKLLPYGERLKRLNLGRSLVDGQGARRVVSYLLEKLKRVKEELQP